jgi:hypothetical protein
VAVDHNFGPFGQPDSFTKLRLVESDQLLDREVARAGDVALARVARRSLGAVVLGRPADVEDGHFTEAPGELVEVDVAQSEMCAFVLPVPWKRFRWHTWSDATRVLVETMSVPVAPTWQGA